MSRSHIFWGWNYQMHPMNHFRIWIYCTPPSKKESDSNVSLQIFGFKSNYLDLRTFVANLALSRLRTFWGMGQNLVVGLGAQIHFNGPGLLFFGEMLSFHQHPLFMLRLRYLQGKPLFFLNVLVLYGNCPNSFRPPIPSVKQANVEKSAPNHPGKPLQPPPPLWAIPIWKQHISKRGFP